MNSVYKDPAMQTLITRTIRSAMVAQGQTYANLSDSLAQRGIHQSVGTLRSKVNSGTMGASLFIHILVSLDSDVLDTDTLAKRYAAIQSSSDGDG